MRRDVGAAFEVLGANFDALCLGSLDRSRGEERFAVLSEVFSLTSNHGRSLPAQWPSVNSTYRQKMHTYTPLALATFPECLCRYC